MSLYGDLEEDMLTFFLIHGRVKPKSLFAQASSKRLQQGNEGLFGAKATPPASVSPTKE